MAGRKDETIQYNHIVDTGLITSTIITGRVSVAAFASGVAALQIRAGQQSMTVNKGVLTASIYDILIIVTTHFFL